MTNYIGNDSADEFIGGSGRDALWGRGGNDRLDGDGGNDLIYGGDGDDVIFDGLGRDRVNGQAGNDLLVMSSLFSGSGAKADTGDRIDGGDGIDYVVYLPFTFDGPTVLYAAHPRTVVDFLDSSKNAGLAAGDVIVNVEGYIGGRGKDSVFGDNNANIFQASLGNDFYSGRGGEDIYVGFNGFPLVQDVIPVTMKLGFGATATSYAAKAGVSVDAGQAVALYEIWIDANGDKVRDVSELTYEADVLQGIEHFVGTAGQDVLNGSDDNETFGTGPASGQDYINGGGGFDTLDFDERYGYTGAVQVDLGAGTLVQDELVSQIVNIEGVSGSANDDQIVGSAADNVLNGNEGNDSIDGAEGIDRLFGGAGLDILFGGIGNDVLDGGSQADVLDGGDGTDTASYASSETSVAVSLLRNAGFVPVIDGVRYDNADSVGDTLVDIEYVIGSVQDDILSGDHKANKLEGRDGNDKLIGCGGNDLIYGEGDPSSNIPNRIIDHTLDDNIADDCDCDDEDEGDISHKYDDDINGGDGNDRLFGQLGNDEICGGNGNDIISGGSGKDVIKAGAGNDTISGDGGADIIYAQAGDDVINGGESFDIIFGGAGRDTVTYETSGSAVRVDLSQFWRNAGGDAASDYISAILDGLANGEDVSQVLTGSIFVQLLQVLDSDPSDSAFTIGVPDVLISVEDVTGSKFDDDLSGSEATNIISGLEGNDRIQSLGGNDSVDGGTGADQIAGGAGNDEVFGGLGNDTIDGGDGRDELHGGAGADLLTGGLGRDRFFMEDAFGTGNVDRITDFAPGDDAIMLSTKLFVGLGRGVLAGSAFVNGTAALDANDRIIYNSATGALLFDDDGNGAHAAVQFAFVDPGLTLSASNFVAI